jgi:peptide/nickel transport system substrate-binding protein
MRVNGQSGSSSNAGGLPRRRFLGLILGSTGLALAAACQSTPAPAPTAAPAKPTDAPKPSEASKPAAGATTAAAATSVPAQAAPAQAKPTDAAKPAAAGAEQPKPGGTVVVARPNEGNGFDPATSLGGPTAEVEGLVYEGLVRPKPIAPGDVKPGAGIASTLEPGLAESWKTSEDGLTWTFALRKNVKFHDGTSLDADAVIVNIDRMLNESSPFYFKGKMVNAISRYGQVAAYRAVDPGTVEIKLKNKYAPFLGAIAHPNAGIVSPTALKKYGEDIAKNLVGTGPFKFSEWRPNETIAFERNPEWWGGKANLDKVVFRNIPEPSVQTAQLQAGSVNMAVGINPDSVPILEKDPNVVVYKTTGDLNGIKIRCDKKPFDDIRVRQALTYALDREAITKTVYGGLGSVANSPLPPNFAEYDPSIKPIPYDVEKAKALLAEAGYASGFTMRVVSFNAPLTVNPVGGDKLAEVLQPYWAKVGIQAKIESQDIAAWRAKRLAGDFDILMDGFEGAGDPDDVFYQAYHSDTYNTSNNATFYKDPKLDQLIDQARREYDPAKRKPMYVDLQKQIYDLSLWVYVNFVDILMASHQSVKNVQFGAQFSARAFENTWMAS